METTIKGKFFISDYGRLTLVDDRDQSLDELLSHSFKKGTIIEVAISLKATSASIPLCKEKNKYGSVCNSLLQQDGTCPAYTYHADYVPSTEQ